MSEVNAAHHLIGWQAMMMFNVYDELSLLRVHQGGRLAHNTRVSARRRKDKHTDMDSPPVGSRPLHLGYIQRILDRLKFIYYCAGALRHVIPPTSTQSTPYWSSVHLQANVAELAKVWRLARAMSTL
jgi:hypothetical protein